MTIGELQVKLDRYNPDLKIDVLIDDGVTAQIKDIRLDTMDNGEDGSGFTEIQECRLLIDEKES